ncbi:MAG: TatD family hydrolase [Nanoarchaeota archaeon]
MFIDVHAHLDILKNLSDVIDNCKKKNILIVSQGVNLKTNKVVLKLTEKYDSVKAAIGLYPDEILKLNDGEIEEEIKFIEKNKENIVAIGEIGLDDSYSDMEKQKEVFEKLVKLAIKINKPIIVHSRKAELEVIEILESLKCKKVIMHCFSGNKKLVERIIKNKWSLSIPTNVKYSLQFQEDVFLCPIEQLLCETDSPFLSPDKKFPNTPENVIESYKKIAEIKKLKLDKVERIIEENYKRLFK